MEFNSDQTCTFYYSIDGNELEQGNRRIFRLKRELGLEQKLEFFLLADGETEKDGYADFSYFKVTKANK